MTQAVQQPASLRSDNSDHSTSTEAAMYNNKSVRIERGEWKSYEQLEELINRYYRAEHMKKSAWNALSPEVQELLERRSR
jgi:hypothetical protein